MLKKKADDFSFSHNEIDTLEYIFLYCSKVNNLWSLFFNQIRRYDINIAENIGNLIITLNPMPFVINDQIL